MALPLWGKTIQSTPEEVLESNPIMIITTTVTLLAHEGDETFALDPAQESELLAAIAEADRGELISAFELLEKIRHS